MSTQAFPDQFYAAHDARTMTVHEAQEILAAEIAEKVIARLREDGRLDLRDGPFTQGNMDGLAETVFAVLGGRW